VSSPAVGVFETLVGQKPVIEQLSRAASGDGMTHAWLFVGPPGSGRSNAAMAFATALECEQGTGCGVCRSCHTAKAGSHPDITVVRTEQLSIGVAEVKDLVRRSALSPNGSKWQVLLMEDADRLTEPACNALLKAIEEPNARTVWLLCAPTSEDLLPTIRSRCRMVTLSTPSPAEVAEFLVRVHQVPDTIAAHAARASQGHIGRAKALALDEPTRNRRQEIVRLAARMRNLGSGLNGAANIIEAAKEEAAAITATLDARDKTQLDAAYGVEQRGRRPREYSSALKAMEKEQSTRAKRRVLDVVDRSLMDLVSVYRDAIALSLGSATTLVNEEIRADVVELCRVATPERLLTMIDAIFTAREQMLEFNVQPQIALEGMVGQLVLEQRSER
jgi:DNA polymerase-3 subunit delta'